MCDFTRCQRCVHRRAALMYMERLAAREAVIRSFTVPQILSVCHLSLSLSLLFSLYSLSLSQTHKHTYLSVPYLLPSTAHPPLHPLFGLISPSPPQLRHPGESNSACCSTPSWHVGQGRWSPFRFLASTSLFSPPPPGLCAPRRLSTFPQHAWCISRGGAWRPGSTAPESLVWSYSARCVTFQSFFAFFCTKLHVGVWVFWVRSRCLCSVAPSD